MIAELTPYVVMKKSGVPWLEMVPQHWDVRRLKSIAKMLVSNVDKHSNHDEVPIRLCNYVDVYKNDRIHSKMTFMRATATRDEINRFRLQQGDVLITKDSETWNDIGVPAIVKDTDPDLVCGYHLAILRPYRKTVMSEYLFRSLQSNVVAYQFHIEANGVTRYGLSHSSIKSIRLPMPPLLEQSLIVRFLDHVDRRIRLYVRAKQKLIRLLEEHKQAIIDRAVSRGLDANVRLKPSGVEWLGNVPEHWQMVALKRATLLLRDGTHLPPPRASTGVPLLSVRNIIGGEFRRRHDDSLITEPDYYQLCRSFIPQENDVLLAIVGATLGKVAIVPQMDRFQIQRSLAICRPKPTMLSSRFLEIFLRSSGFQRALWSSVAFSAQPGIYLNALGDFPIVLPTVEEQNQIVDALTPELDAIGLAINSTKNEISLLREYRTRLVADVVTGKLDVREAAAHLPDESQEAELPDDNDAEIAPEMESNDELEEALEPIEA